jgi:transcriptional regulator with XRE-family HTH domain
MPPSRLETELRRELRKKKMSAAAVAREAGIKPAWFRQVMTSRIERPSPDALRAIAKVLGLPGDRLLALTDQLGAPSATAPEPADPLVGALIAQTKALDAQTAAISELVAMLRQRVEQRDADIAEALPTIQRFLEQGRVDRAPQRPGSDPDPQPARRRRRAPAG